MRPSLLPGLLAAARRNVDRGATSIRLFEIGRRYLADGERPTVGLAARRRQRSRAAGSRARRSGFDAFDAKAEALALLAAAGAPVDNLQLSMGARRHLASRPVGDARPRPKNVARRVRRAPPARRQGASMSPAGTVAAEIYLDAIPAPRASDGHARSAYTPPALQAVTRDFAFLVPADLAGRRAGPRGPRRRQGGDHRCAAVRPLTKASQGLSLAIEVTLQPGEKSFTDAEIAEVSRKIVAAAEKLGAPAQGVSALIAAWTRASISSRFRPGGMTSPTLK